VRRSLPLALAAASVLAAGAAGCGEGEKKSEDSGSPAPSKPAPANPAPAKAGDVKVSMKDIQFEPKAAKAKVGQTITWTNDEPVEHNVVAKSGADFSSQAFGQGKTFKAKVEQPGKIDYVCTLHPGMDGTIEVTE